MTLPEGQRYRRRRLSNESIDIRFLRVIRVPFTALAKAKNYL